MARYIDADKMVPKDNAYTTFPHDLAGCDDNDLVRWINEQPTADVAPKSEVAREIFEEIEEALQYEIDLEDKYGRNAWGQGDVSAFQTHEYTEDKLETIQIALSLLKKKYTEEKEGDGK